ncbi:MAG: CHASE2 domain-containing protein [Proteobacteria bacterium]|nr:CHASE2 domain-containing protein [Pseudomonadota bacterium]
MKNTLSPTPSPAVMPSLAKPDLAKILLTTAILLTLCLSSIFLFPPQAIQYLTTKTTDLILRIAKAPASEIDVVIVEIDESSLKKYGQWPWPRDLFAKLLKSIQKAGATSVGIDVIFPERDRSSPIYRQDSFAADTFPIPTEFLDHDLSLAKSLATGPFVLGYEFLFGHRQEVPAVECPIPPISFSRMTLANTSNPGMNFHRADGVLCNYLPLTKAAPSAGFLNGAPDNDGILRRLPLMIEYGRQLYPSFALAVLMRFYDLQTLVLASDGAQLPGLSLAGRYIPLDSQGHILLGPPNPSRPSRFSAANILANTIDSSQLRQKIVLVGSTAQGLSQGYPTPYSSSESLLDLHAAAIMAIAGKIQTTRPLSLPFYEAALSILFSLVLAQLCTRWPTGWSVGFCLVSTVASWIGAQMLLQFTGLLFSPLLPSVTIIISGFLLITLKFRYLQLQAKSEKGDALLLLKSSESSLRSILHTVPDIIFRLDDCGNITFISPAICRYQTSPEALLGDSIFSYVAPTDLDLARFRLNERRTGERATFDLEIRLLLTKENHTSEKDYSFFSVSAEGLYRSNLPKAQGFIGTQGIVKDITGRKKLERQLLQAQKMEAIGNLAAGVAHDLNNILSGLVSYPDLLLMEIPKDSPLHGKISIIQKSGQKAAAIVQDLLSLARRNITIPSISNINLIIAEYLQSVEYLQLQARYPNIAVDTNLAKDLMNIKGSTIHLSKVIMNLLHNGMEAMPGGGNILVTTSNIHLDQAVDGYEHIPSGEYVCLSVADNGIGIPQPDLPRIFEPFFSRKEAKKSGTGLGMTIIWATVKDHQGYLDIHSQEGQGTVFTIYLPATAASSDHQQNRVVLEDYLGSGTILVVDDVAEQLHITSNMLRKIGYTVFTASSGNEAIAMVGKQQFDLILLDMIMPGGIDGLETYKKILSVSPKQKAIITSGYSKSDRVMEMQDLGAGTFVQKPFTLEQIGVAVKTLLTKPGATEDIPANQDSV